MLQARLLNSLAKVFLDREPQAPVLRRGTVLRGETFSCQLAFQSSERIQNPLQVACSGSLAPLARLRRIGHLPVGNIGECLRPGAETLGFERRKPGLFPDVLFTNIDFLHANAGTWHSFWIDLPIPANFAAGKHELVLQLHNTVEREKPAFRESRPVKLSLEVIPATLPEQTLRHTEWFHCDGLAMAYGLEPWSEPYWELLATYFRHYTAHGMNMLLTPLFTPPLDTRIGGERLTTQLVGVVKTGRKYQFDFSRLERWIKLARKCGVRYFEYAHLFTQGGGKATPKIVATVNGRERRIFGWHVASNAPSYRAFLDALLPELAAFTRRMGIERDVYFHVTDEPNAATVPTYAHCAAILKRHLEGFKILDAASHVEYVDQGLLSIPVVIEHLIEPFLSRDLQERWTYYCGGPDLPYSNRLHTMPASANRIMGTLLYVYNCDGFLHWGYNFWNEGSTGRYADPLSLSPDYYFHPGDPCLVFPGPDGPIDSMRLMVFCQGLQDLRALRLLESLTSRKQVLALIRRVAGRELKMNDFPIDPLFLPKLRDTVNRRIKAVQAR
ncbi:MAG: DUF4091 domain-containing protein [Lentisphaerae bacterium]|jgi:hypothetical protein|nr:DUF4091 domain-containing protein [Lentisphaerota bacterium]